VAAVGRRGRKRKEAVPDGVLDVEVEAADHLVAAVPAHKLQSAVAAVLVPAERLVAAGHRQADSQA
jgi:hypothetical protein